MYYVIKKQPNKIGASVIGFGAPKYIASKKNKNVIFLFQKDGNVIRKWVKLENILLLTDDKEYFLKVFKEFQKVEKEQQALVDEAKAKLEESMTNYTETINAHIEEYEEIRDTTDVPCILKELS